MPRPIEPTPRSPDPSSKPRRTEGLEALARAAIPITLAMALAATPLWGAFVTLAVVFALWKCAARIA